MLYIMVQVMSVHIKQVPITTQVISTIFVLPHADKTFTISYYDHTSNKNNKYDLCVFPCRYNFYDFVLLSHKE